MARDSRRTTSVGILISPRGITVAQARSRGEGVDVQVRGAIEVPAGAVSGAEILDPVRVGQALRTLWRRTGITSRYATVALLAPAYSMRALRVPMVVEKERRTLVRGELEQAQALPFGAGALDFLWMSPPAGAPSGTPADVYAYYLGDTAIDTIRKSLEVAGLEVAAIEPASLTMMRAYLAVQQQRQPVALLCPSAKHTDLCLYDGKQVRQMRRIPAGADDLRQTSAAPGTRDMLPDVAGWDTRGRTGYEEESANLLNAPDDFEDVQLTNWPENQAPSAAEQEPFRTINDGGQGTPKGDFLASEVSRTLAFFTRENPEEAHPQSMVVLAPRELAMDFRTILSGALSIPVSAVNPLEAIDLPQPAPPAPKTDDLDAYLPAVGAALAAAGAELGIPGIDLSQQEAGARARRSAPRVLRVGMAGSTLWLLLAAAAAILLMLLQTRANMQISHLTEQIVSIRRERAPILRYHQMSVAARAEEQRSRVPADAILGRIAASTTSGVGLTAVHINPDGKILIEGRALGTENVRHFALALGRGENVKLPVIENTKREPTGQLTFKINALFRDPAPPAQQTGKE